LALKQGWREREGQRLIAKLYDMAGVVGIGDGVEDVLRILRNRSILIHSDLFNQSKISSYWLYTDQVYIE
jgi:hypothetical protein